jgi:hypothetical protein
MRDLTAASIQGASPSETYIIWSGHLESRAAAVNPSSSYKEQDLGARAQIFVIQPFGGVTH